MILLLCALLLAIPQETSAPPESAKVWVGREAEYEEFLKTAPVVKVEELTIGVTKPRRAFVEPGGLCDSFAWKVLPPGIHRGFWDSYKSEIAAYELDKLLGLGMVPVAVERRVEANRGAAVLWLNGVHSWEDALRLPKHATWNRNLIRMKMWDNLVGNNDRNKGNLLMDNAGNLFLIDHSRAFATSKKLHHELDRVDKELWDRMQALDFETLKAKLGGWIGKGEIKAILKRRDLMAEAIQETVAKRGEHVYLK